MPPPIHDFTIAQIGPYPPPFGGVSVHVRRLHRLLLRAGIQSSVYCDPTLSHKDEGVFSRRIIHSKPWCYLNWLFEPGHPLRADTIHLHYSWGAYSPSLWAMLCRRKNVVITVHNQMDHEEWARLSWFQKLAATQVIKSQRVQWIAVSDPIAVMLQQRGVSPERISVIPAFLPPENLRDPAVCLPANCNAFIAAHTPLITTYGFRLWLDENGVDIYGFDLCLAVIRELTAEFPDVGLVICIPEITLPDYYEALQTQVKQWGIGNHVWFITEPVDNAFALWQMSDLYVRATTTDGDSVAVREALAMGTPVVASDASPRPAGVTLFNSRDLDSLLAGVRKALAKKREAPPSLPSEDCVYSLRLLSIYGRFTKKGSPSNQ